MVKETYVSNGIKFVKVSRIDDTRLWFSYDYFDGSNEEIELKEWLLNYLPTQMAFPKENYDWYMKLDKELWDENNNDIQHMQNCVYFNPYDMKEFREFIGLIHCQAVKDLQNCVNEGITGITFNSAVENLKMIAVLNKDVTLSYSVQE